MGEAVHIAGAEDKTASQLKGISSEFVLRMTGGFGTDACLGVVASQQMKQICAFKFHYGIGFASFVDEKWEGDAGFLAKSKSINAISEPHSDQIGSAVPEGLLVRAQLRDVLTTEDSTVVAQENYHGRLADP